jgi:hypothetical protein
MISILFEKKGALRLSRQIVLDKEKVEIKYCQGGSLEAEINSHFASIEEASYYLEKIAGSFRSAGFNEHDNPNQGCIGTIAHLESPLGIGRIRVDAIGDVFFEPKNHVLKKLKQGQRVLVFGIKESAKPAAPFMFNSRLVATEVQLLPTGKKHSKSELPDAVRSEIIKLAGDSLKGFRTQKKIDHLFQIGQLVYGFYPGIYRIIQIKNDSIICEELYNKKLLRASGALNQWAPNFCRPLQKEVFEIIKDDQLLLNRS